MGRSAELDGSVYAASGKIVLSYQQLKGGDKDLSALPQLNNLVLSGEIERATITDLGEVLSSPARTWSPSTGRPVVFRDVQSGFGDVALGLSIYEKCVAAGVGTRVTL
jgi:hypothetical protein